MRNCLTSDVDVGVDIFERRMVKVHDLALGIVSKRAVPVLGTSVKLVGACRGCCSATFRSLAI